MYALAVQQRALVKKQEAAHQRVIDQMIRSELTHIRENDTTFWVLTVDKNGEIVLQMSRQVREQPDLPKAIWNRLNNCLRSIECIGALPFELVDLITDFALQAPSSKPRPPAASGPS